MTFCRVCGRVLLHTACGCAAAAEAVKSERERVARRCMEIAQNYRVWGVIVDVIRREFGL